MTREEITKNIVRGITDKIEATTDIDDWAEFWGFTRDDYEEFLDSALEQEPKTEWIPVSEGLPEKNVWVLVTVVQGSGWYVEIMRIDKYKEMFTDNIDYYDSIIAWMPLPKPYESQEREEV